MRRSTILAAVLCALVIGGAAWGYRHNDLSRLARELDAQVARFNDHIARTLHHQGEGAREDPEVRLLMASAGLRGQASMFRRLADSRANADLRVGFSEFRHQAGRVDEEVRKAHTARSVRQHWEDIRGLIRRVDAELRPTYSRGPRYDDSRGPRYDDRHDDDYYERD